MTRLQPEEWNRIRHIFHEALDRDPPQRASFLDTACSGDLQLRAEVESLLALHDDDPTYLERPASEASPRGGDSLEGKRIGAYEIEQEIGRGGMGVVYLAYDTRLKRRVALKALPSDHVQDPTRRERLRREARAAAALSHPGVATVYALEEEGDAVYIVSEYVRGRTLRAMLDEGAYPSHLVVATALQMARALAAAHELGIVHRDFKPDNVIVTDEGTVKILDFGIARLTAFQETMTVGPGLTAEGVAIGTPAYMSPEQLAGQAVDFRSDLFSFGVVLYELATGVHPWLARRSAERGGGSPAVGSAKGEGGIARASGIEQAASPGSGSDANTTAPPVDARVPPRLQPVLSRCLQPAPAQRYASTQELVRDLERLSTSDRIAAEAAEGALLTAAPADWHAVWWWGFHQLMVAIVYAVMLWPAWMARGFITETWRDGLFLAVLVAAAIGATLRAHLWFVAGFHPGAAARQRQQTRVLLGAANVAFIALVAVTGLLVASVRPVLSAVLVGVSVCCAVASVVIEPTTTAAAFGRREHEATPAPE